MEHTKEKKKRKYSKHTIALGALLCAVVLYAGITIMIQTGDLAARQERNSQLSAEIDALETEMEELDRQEEYIGSDAYVEKKAREEFGFVKEGEILFKVQDNGQIDVYRGEDTASQDGGEE